MIVYVQLSVCNDNIAFGVFHWQPSHVQWMRDAEPASGVAALEGFNGGPAR